MKDARLTTIYIVMANQILKKWAKYSFTVDKLDLPEVS